MSLRLRLLCSLGFPCRAAGRRSRPAGPLAAPASPRRPPLPSRRRRRRPAPARGAPWRTRRRRACSRAGRQRPRTARSLPCVTKRGYYSKNALRQLACQEEGAIHPVAHFSKELAGYYWSMPAIASAPLLSFWAETCCPMSYAVCPS